MAITKEQIYQAADELSSNGQEPTLAAIRKALGGGSFTTISEAMKEWRQARNQDEAKANTPPPMPDAVQNALETLGGEVWKVAMEIAQAKLQTERDALEKTRADMENQQREAAEMSDQMDAEIEKLKAQVSALETDKQQLQQQHGETKTQYAVIEARYEEQSKRVEDILAELKETRQQLAELRKLEREYTSYIQMQVAEKQA